MPALPSARNGAEQSTKTTPADTKIALAAMLDARRFDIDNPPPQAVTVFKLGDSTIATRGNVIGVQGKAKTAKTALLGAMIASTMEPDGDCLGIISQNPSSFAVIHFDTEQSPFDHHAIIKRALRRAGKDRPPEWLRSYCITDVPLLSRRASMALELERGKEAHGGIHSAIIDGVGDLCADLNDPAEAFELIDYLHQLAIRFDTIIVCVLHENPGSDNGKMRGHLGSQLERKAETNLRLEKNADGVTVVYSDRARHAHIPKEKGTCFKWCDEAQMHVSTSTARDAKFEARKEELRTFAEEIFRKVKDPFGFSWAEMHRKIEKLAKLKPDGARKRFQSMLKMNVITKTLEGKYLLSK
jgi:hypothetical protein